MMDATSTTPPTPAAVPDADDLARLCAQLAAHDAARGGATAPARQDLFRACCQVLLAGPAELRGEALSAAGCDQARPVLSSIEANSLPEARICRLWIQPDSAAADVFAELSVATTWEPVRVLALRALAQLGRRDLVAAAVTGVTQLSWPLVDVWMDASLAGNGTFPEAGSTSTPVQGAWSCLLQTEHALAAGHTDPRDERNLTQFAAAPAPASPLTIEAVERRRLAPRAAGALVRARLSQHRDDGGVLASAAGLLLPAWERSYLAGLVRWVVGDVGGAISELKRSLEQSPLQSPTRLALGSAMAPRDPEAALAVLTWDHPTRQALIASAAILARLGRFELAQQAIERCEAAGSEPLRFTWRPGRLQAAWQENVLRTALAERRSDWPAAAEAWSRACSAGHPPRSLAASRRLLQMRAQSDVATKEFDDVWREIGPVVLTGSDRLFRAFAAADRWPQVAEKDLRALARQRAWCERERAAGAWRLLAVAEGFGRLGLWADAALALEQAGVRLPANKQAVARLLLGNGDLCGRLREFIAAVGSGWPQAMPFPAQQVPLIARRAATEVCDDQRWDSALELAAEFERAGPAWAWELAAVIRLRCALGVAATDPKEAERQLAGITA